jgi:uncharacterized protein YndB with AHSA1/START domain
MRKGTKARSVADVTQGTIIATVDIEASPDRVFRALASSEIVEWWGAPGVYRTTEWTGEVKVGGRWRAVGVEEKGKSFSVEGEFVEVDPPRKLVHTWKPDWDAGKATTVTYRLEPIDGGTRVTLRHEGFDGAASCSSHAEGWPMVLGWLQSFVEPKRPPRSFFLLRLIPPRPTFPVDMTAAERAVMMEHSRYWARLLEDGYVAAVGPVGDPKGAWGVAIVELDSEAELKSIEANDPVTKSGLGFRYEVLPMLSAIVRP